jgi:hypothetical protein
MKKEAIVYFISFLFIATVASAGNRITMKLNKEEYLLYEPIWLTIQTDRIKKDSVSSGKITIRNSTGKDYFAKIIDTNPIVWPIKDTTRNNEFTFDILVFFGEGENGKLSARYFFPVDSYTISGEIILSGNKKIFANIVSFSVKESTQDEQEAYKLLMDGKRSFYSQDKQGAMMLYNELANRFPKSVYAPQALYRKATLFMYDENDERELESVNYLVDLINKYPESQEAFESIDKIMLVYFNRGKFYDGEKKLRELSTKHNNVRYISEIEKVLYKWKQYQIREEQIKKRKELE